MQFTQPQRHMVMALLTAFLAAIPAQAGAADTASTPEYAFEVRVCQVLTNITDSGLISQTLPGPNGWFQIIHERLDDTELVMDGPTLTWNGKSAPDNPKIIQLAAPRVTTMQGERSIVVRIGDDAPVQYMNRKDDGLFELNEDKSDGVGVSLSLKPTGSSQDGVLACDFSFKYSWVKDREKIDGVNLEVGQPILGHVATEGAVKMRLGEWSCYRAPADSEGWIYVFLRAEKRTGENAPQDTKEILSDKTSKDVDSTRNQDKETNTSSGNGPKVQVGGSVQLRVGVRK